MTSSIPIPTLTQPGQPPVTMVAMGEIEFTLQRILGELQRITTERATPWANPTFKNGWTNFGGTNPTARYRILNGTHVELGGVVKGGSAGWGVPIFTLPLGFRPSSQFTILVLSDTQGQGRLDVYPNGDVCLSVYLAGGSNAAVTLAGVLIPLA